jgi:hypothetical protein
MGSRIGPHHSPWRQHLPRTRTPIWSSRYSVMYPNATRAPSIVRPSYGTLVGSLFGLIVAGPASPEELKRFAGLVKDGGWGDSKNHDFIRSADHGYWALDLSPESDSVRFRAWLLNTFASMVRVQVAWASHCDILFHSSSSDPSTITCWPSHLLLIPVTFLFFFFWH